MKYSYQPDLGDIVAIVGEYKAIDEVVESKGHGAVVIQAHRTVSMVKILSGPHKGKVVWSSNVNLVTMSEKKYEFRFETFVCNIR